MELTRIVAIGAIAILASLLFLVLSTFILNEHYSGIIIGISCYSFWLGYITAPLTRLTLFATMVPKATASALISLMTMLIVGFGNELAGWIYESSNNMYFSLYCAASGLAFYLSFLFMRPKKNPAHE